MLKQYNFWPFQEAEKILERFADKKKVTFATGYGPSGMPHIGTFGEVFKTVVIANALKHLSPNIDVKIIAVSDDMDGLRKIPENVPNSDMLFYHLEKPLTSVPDPFGIYESYGHHMNALLCKFLDLFGFEYEFKSATECYKSGIYDKKLLLLLSRYEEVMGLMLPTLGEERRKTYSPFLPICIKTGRVLQVPIVKVNSELGTISYKSDDGELIETSVIGGKCKLQWKPDWGMRWAALNVNYETHGKDLTPSTVLSAQICKILGESPPLLFCYELFLDQNGRKISKSKGNGLSIEDWLRYAPKESISLYMLQSPKKAKRLCLDVIPRVTDEYLRFIKEYKEDPDVNNPVWHIHNGEVPFIETFDISFSLLLNLATACNAESKEILWGFVRKYVNEVRTDCFLDQLIGFAVSYYHDFIRPNKCYRLPNEVEKKVLYELRDIVSSLEAVESAEEIQNRIFSLGKKYNSLNLRSWFEGVYEMLFGQKQGPRLGSFIKIYGVENFIILINNAIEGSLVNKQG